MPSFVFLVFFLYLFFSQFGGRFQQKCFATWILITKLVLTVDLAAYECGRKGSVGCISEKDYLHKSRWMNSERFVDNHVEIRHLVKNIIRCWFLQIMRKTFKCHLNRSMRFSCVAELIPRIDKNHEFEFLFSRSTPFRNSRWCCSVTENPDQPSWFYLQHNRTKFDPP